MQLPVRLVLLSLSAALPSQSPRFAEVGEALPDGIGQVFAAADYDADLDIVTPMRGAPGDAQRMAVFGRSGDGWFLGASLPAPGAISLPPLGQLFLDPATLVVLAGGVMPAGGSDAFTLPLPAGVGGTTLTWQALVGARFSNATDTRILP